MRKSSAFQFALIGTVLLLLLGLAGRLLYIRLHTQDFEAIAGKGVQQTLSLTENETPLDPLTDAAAVSAVCDALRGYTYTEYPRLLHPGSDTLEANRLTVTFSNGRSIGVDADGFVFVNDKLRDVAGSRGKELYHKLYVLFHPTATT